MRRIDSRTNPHDDAQHFETQNLLRVQCLSDGLGGTRLARYRHSILEAREMNPLIAYLLAAIVTWSPPSDHDYYELREETLDRYAAIAHDIAAVALDPAEAPLFGGPQGRAQTALLLASVAFYESGGFRRDVDLGLGTSARGDSGRSWCLMQINIGDGTTIEHWTGRNLVEDRQKCLRAGLRRLRQSFDMCQNQSFVDRLSGYTKGRCTDGDDFSHRRLNRALDWWSSHRVDGVRVDQGSQAMVH
jgi:hypothetical protein